MVLYDVGDHFGANFLFYLKLFSGRFASRIGAAPLEMMFGTPSFLPVSLRLRPCIRKKVPNLLLFLLMQEASDAHSELQTVTLFRPIRSLQCSW